MTNTSKDSSEQIANLPPTGETGAGIPEFKPNTTFGSLKTPPYKEESLLQMIRDNWVLVAFVLTLIWGFVTQVWTPLVELKQRVNVLEKSVDKQDNFLEELKKNVFFQDRQYSDGNTTPKETPPSTQKAPINP